MWKTDKDLFIRGSAELALDIIRKLTIQDKNVCFSPYSLRALLGMVYAGARGDTAAQMAKTLHFPADHQTLHSQIAEVEQQLLAGSKNGGYELRIGNRAWSQLGYPLLQSFLNVIAAHYQSGIEQVDFSRCEQTCRAMNRWIEDQTANLIKDLVNPSMLTPETRLLLISAIYFKGLWLDPFRKEVTRDEEFWVSPQRIARTPMMQQTVDVPYAEYSEVQMVALPYHHLGDRTQPVISMIILLPRIRGELENIMNRLQQSQLERWLHGLNSQKVKIFLPKFKIASLWPPQNALEALGMVNAFNPTTADFSGMTQTDEPFWVQNLLQKAYVSVDEEGTEAAAVSMAIMLGFTATRRPPIPTFRADHPFLFLIRHNSSGSVLFIGRVNNPQGRD